MALAFHKFLVILASGRVRAGVLLGYASFRLTSTWPTSWTTFSLLTAEVCLLTTMLGTTSGGLSWMTFTRNDGLHTV